MPWHGELEYQAIQTQPWAGRRDGWASSSSAWACCGQRLSQSKCMLHGCRRILAQPSIRLVRPHPSQRGKAGKVKKAYSSLWSTPISGTVLVGNWLQPWQLLQILLMKVGTWEEWWNLTREMCWPCRLWRCSCWRNIKLQRGYSDEGGRGAQIFELQREIFQLWWQPHCTRGSEKKMGM